MQYGYYDDQFYVRLCYAEYYEHAADDGGRFNYLVASSGKLHCYDAIELSPSLLTRGPYYTQRVNAFASIDAFYFPKLSSLATKTVATKVLQDARYRLLLFEVVQRKDTRVVKGSDIVNVLHRLDLLETVKAQPACAALVFAMPKTDESGAGGCFECQQVVNVSAGAEGVETDSVRLISCTGASGSGRTRFARAHGPCGGVSYDAGSVASIPQYMSLLRPRDHQPSPIRKRNPQHQASSSNGDAAPVVMMNPVHIQAFGLEDRAEAVIAMGNRQWSLTNLSKWRSESLNAAAAASTIPNGTADRSKEYVRQRQRAYMKQCLTGAKSLA